MLGENDRKADGTWPGDPAPFAGELARRLRRAVGRQLPPEGCKDAREYVIRLIAAEGQSPGSVKGPDQQQGDRGRTDGTGKRIGGP